MSIQDDFENSLPLSQIDEQYEWLEQLDDWHLVDWWMDCWEMNNGDYLPEVMDIVEWWHMFVCSEPSPKILLHINLDAFQEEFNPHSGLVYQDENRLWCPMSVEEYAQEIRDLLFGDGEMAQNLRAVVAPLAQQYRQG